MNDVQRANLRKLANYLSTGHTAMQFDMSEYCVAPSLDEPDLEEVIEPDHHQCGTVGCSLGHGPAAGIDVDKCRSWPEYSNEKFGANPWNNDGIYDWLFSSDWRRTDNTPEGAAKRIYWLLDYGLPENWKAQLFRHDPLCYRFLEAAE